MKHARLRLAAALGVALCRSSPARVYAQELATTAIISSGNTIVPKTVVDHDLRLFFYVGLEGAGHHYLDAVFEKMYKQENGLPQIHIVGFDMKDYFLPTSMSETPEHYAHSYDHSRTTMKSLAERAKSVPSPGTIFKPVGRYSYPCNAGPDKAVQYVDVRRMAETAEAEGVDFRILYLRRSAKDLLLANTFHRKIHLIFGGDEEDFVVVEGVLQDLIFFGFRSVQTENKSSIRHPTFNLVADELQVHPPDALVIRASDGKSSFKADDRPQDRLMHYMQVLFTNIAVMHALLAELESAFVVCHDFDLLGDAEQAFEIAKFVSPNADVARVVAAALVDHASPHHKSNETLPFPGGDMLEQRFQRAFDAFESTYC